MSALSPDQYVSSLDAIDLEALGRDGIRTLLVDLDNTLLPRDTGVFPAAALAFAERVRRADMRACLVSNNWHARVSLAAQELGFELVPRALKPLPFAFRRGLELVGGEPSTTAVVGDQLFTDILGGNMLGMRTILVPPLSASDLPHTLLLRRLEALVLSGRTPVD